MLLSILQRINMKSDTAMNELVLRAKKGDEKVMNDLLIAYTPFIKKTASFVCKRFVDEHDDEFSVAMSGFHEAILHFSPKDNTSLTTFSHLIMKRRLIDHMRKEATRYDAISLLKDRDEDTDLEHYILNQTSIASYSKEQQAAERREEMKEYAKLLGDFDLSFQELVKSSPKHTDSRKTAFQIAQIVAETPEFYAYLLKNKRLPLKELEEIVEVSRKTVERQRKYIIAVVLLINSNFVYIKEYLKGEFI
ncbi:RNA polymerase sigma-I factor [bacterium LRH843]|nr:RNA polymerase sigma-I factor [bacterium LRH843]